MDFKRHIEALHYLLQLWPGKPYRPARIPYLAMETIKISQLFFVLSADSSSTSRRLASSLLHPSPASLGTAAASCVAPGSTTEP